MQQLLNQLENFINGIPGSVYWKDKKGIYLGCNDVVIHKGNLKSKAHIIGKTDHDVWPEFAESIRNVDLEVMKNDKSIEIEETVVLKNGERLYFSSVKRPLKDEEGNIIGVIGNSLDITELKEAKQHAETANHTKTHFLALMGHELRIPLTGIISTANMLVENEMTSDEVKEVGKIIEDSGSYLLTTINSILDFAKLESKKFELFQTRVNLVSLIDEIIHILAATAKEKKLTLQTKYLSPIPKKIITDSRIIRTIMTNLIGNAIKYTDKGEVNVSIKTLRQTQNTVELEISVADTGIGIPEEKIEFIFKRFTQLENAYTRKNSRSGTGLGLSIVKNLAALLNCKIQVKSQLGKGSTFSMIGEFPLPKQNSIRKGIIRDKCITHRR